MVRVGTPSLLQEDFLVEVRRLLHTVRQRVLDLRAGMKGAQTEIEAMVRIAVRIKSVRLE